MTTHCQATSRARCAVRRRRQVATALLEALEPRQLLTIDLTGSFLIAPTSVLSGTKQAIALNVANAGTSAANGTLTISFYAAPEGVTFDPGTATFLGHVAWKVSIGAGSSHVLKDNVLPISAALPAGTYALYAVLNSNTRFVETNTANNTVESPPLAIAQPNYDLLGSFAPSTKLPPAIIAGQTTRATVKAVVTNSSGGTAAIPAGLSIHVQVVARPVGAVDASEDVPLTASPVSVTIGSLAPGKSRTVSVRMQFPASLAAGNYNLVIKADTGNTLAETNETNNDGIFAQTIAVAAPFSDPTLAFDAATVMPPGVVADGRALPLKFDVQNLGNIKIPAGQTSSIAIVAHNLSTGTDTPLQTFAVALKGLAPGATKTFTLSPAVALSLSEGAFQLRATLSTTAPGDVLANNSASEATPLVVGPAFYNLAVQAPTATFNPAILNGTATSGSVRVPVKNLGNSILPAGTLANISLVLRPVGATSSADDIPLGGRTNVSLAGLGLGATRTVGIGATIPATLPGRVAIAAGDYQIIATLTISALTETTLADNTATGPTITIAAPFVDLAIVSAAQNFLTPAAPQSTASGTVVLRNMGNVRVQGNVNIQFFATATGNAQSPLLGAHVFAIDLLPGATSIPLSQALTLNLGQNGMLATTATITARIDPASLNDANPANNQLGAGTVVQSSQYVDLTLFSATQPFRGTAAAGTTATGQILVGNIGSGAGVGAIAVSYYATTTGAIDGNAILLGSQTTTIALGQAQISPTLYVPLTLPSPATTTSYKIIARLTAALDLDNNPGNNLTPVLGTVMVTVAP